MSIWDIHPSGDWVVVPSQSSAALTLWPLGHPRPVVIDGDGGGLTFSPDGRLLAFVSDGAVRVWSIEGTRVSEVRRVPFPENEGDVVHLTFDPDGRFVLTGGDRALLIPLDGGSPRRLEGFPDEVVVATALSPSGRRVAGGTYAGRGPKRIRVWDLESGETRVFDSPTWQAPSSEAGQPSGEAGVFEGGVLNLAFVGEDVLYSAGLEGIWRWDLERGTNERVSKAAPGFVVWDWMSQDGRTAVTRTELRLPNCPTVEILDTATGALESLPRFGGCVMKVSLDPSGTVLLATELDGTVRVGRISAAEPHLILGHDGVDGVALSPDLRWVATSGNGLICLWPMPDLDQPPLHALPHEALLAKLKSLTNLRAVRDPDDPSGWTIEVGPFPGWKDVPTW
jgi:WD40 repeat protein